MFVTALEAQSGELKFGEVTTKLLHEELRRHRSDDKESAYVGKQGPKKLCHFCKKPGHFKKDCYAWKRKQQQMQQHSKERGVVKHEHNASPAMDRNFVFQATPEEANHPLFTWYVDSGASRHMCINQDAFSKLVLTTPQPVYMGNNAAVEAVGVGEVPITMVVDGREYQGHIANVLYVPELAANLLSVNQLTAKGLKVTFAKGRCNITSPNGEVLGKAYLDGKLYKL